MMICQWPVKACSFHPHAKAVFLDYVPQQKADENDIDGRYWEMLEEGLFID